MKAYYAQSLAGRRLQRCYEMAPPRILQYLEAEIAHVVSHLHEGDRVLELGCGYGRVARRLARATGRVVGIDTAAESLALARQIDRAQRCAYARMDAIALGFRDNTFDVVACVQNGIGAFHVDPALLVRESLRVTRSGGFVLLSTYADSIWPERLAWFEEQAREGLIGPIDHEQTGRGVIVCTDGFRAGRMTPADFGDLCAAVGVEGAITEIDRSSLFCAIVKQEPKL